MGRRVKEIRIRQGLASDRRVLVRLLASEQMATDIDPSEFVIGEVNGRLLGAARLAWVGKEDAILRPIVVATEARETGIGRALLKRFFGICASISVIARSDAVPFYRRLGFTAVDWSSVPGEYREECESCDDFAECRPMAMRWTRKRVPSK